MPSNKAYDHHTFTSNRVVCRFKSVVEHNCTATAYGSVANDVAYQPVSSSVIEVVFSKKSALEALKFAQSGSGSELSVGKVECLLPTYRAAAAQCIKTTATRLSSALALLRLCRRPPLLNT